MTSAFAAGGDHRSLPVPDGLDGMRLDQAVSRLFGLSRTAAAALVEAGDALVDGAARPNSHKVKAGSWLEVTLPAPVAPPTVVPQAVPGLRVVYADDDIVVVDKPVGRGRAPQPRVDRPDRDRRARRDRAPHLHQRRRRAAGRGAPARRGHHRDHGGGQERAGVQRR